MCSLFLSPKKRKKKTVGGEEEFVEGNEVVPVVQEATPIKKKAEDKQLDNFESETISPSRRSRSSWSPCQKQIRSFSGVPAGDVW
mmetsp:Transcript_21380/g.52628  ORF Transcript_21380/g.52628 Transcript_21380/m.52628 type:complete len:85 (+) Transcript_21380:463-717(+)